MLQVSSKRKKLRQSIASIGGCSSSALVDGEGRGERGEEEVEIFLRYDFSLKFLK